MVKKKKVVCDTEWYEIQISVCTLLLAHSLGWCDVSRVAASGLQSPRWLVSQAVRLTRPKKPINWLFTKKDRRPLPALDLLDDFHYFSFLHQRSLLLGSSLERSLGWVSTSPLGSSEVAVPQGWNLPPSQPAVLQQVRTRDSGPCLRSCSWCQETNDLSTVYPWKPGQPLTSSSRSL